MKPVFKKCIDCLPPVRYPGCQNKCEYGKRIKAELDEYNRRELARRKATNDVVGVKTEDVIKARRRGKR